MLQLTSQPLHISNIQLPCNAASNHCDPSAQKRQKSCPHVEVIFAGVILILHSFNLQGLPLKMVTCFGRNVVALAHYPANRIISKARFLHNFKPAGSFTSRTVSRAPYEVHGETNPLKPNRNWGFGRNQFMEFCSNCSC